MKRSFMFFLVGLSACIDPYNPPEIGQSESILVIDGFVNSSGPSKITLSRSQNLNDPSQPIYETGAEVWVEDTQGNKVFLRRITLADITLPHTPSSLQLTN